MANQHGWSNARRAAQSVAIRRWQEMTGGHAVLDATGARFSDVAAERLADIPDAEAA